MDTVFNKITSYPLAIMGSVGGAITFEDLKPLILLIAGFFADLLINYLKKKYNDKS